MSAPASDSTVNLVKMTDLLSRVKIASENVQKFEALAPHHERAGKLEAKHNLQTSLRTEKKAVEESKVAINSALAKSPGSVKLLATFAITFNSRVAAEESLARADLKLKTDQEIIQYIQKALKAVVTGGQSDMNSELGSMRLKLYQALQRIPGDNANVTLSASEMAKANMNLGNATSNADADPLASIAVGAATYIYAHSAPLKRIQEDPLAWNWTVN